MFPVYFPKVTPKSCARVTVQLSINVVIYNQDGKTILVLIPRALLPQFSLYKHKSYLKRIKRTQTKTTYWPSANETNNCLLLGAIFL